MKAVIIAQDKNFNGDLTTTLKGRWHDCQCYYASRAREGIDFLRTHNPDLVIMDLEIEDTDCFEAIKDIRGISNVPMVILSNTKDDQSTTVKALYYGADRIIKKPIRPLEFISRINALLRQCNRVNDFREDTDFIKILLLSQSTRRYRQEDQYKEAFSVN